jgi:phage host-nuclease inhibitor protein Gam
MRDLGAVDLALKEIGEVNRRIEAITANMNEEIAKSRSRAEVDIAPLQARIRALETGMEAFAIQHKEELFKKAKTKRLNFGEIGFRQSTKITVSKNTLDRLIEMEADDAIHTVRRPNKDVLATWDDEELREVGAKKKTEDVFGYKVKEEAIEELVA